DVGGRPRERAQDDGSHAVVRLRQAVREHGAALRSRGAGARMKRSPLMRAVEALLALLLLAMVVMVFGNVVLRYAFNSGITMSEELSRFCFVWLTFIGAIVAMREGTHLGMDNLVARLPRAGKLACLGASQALIAGCCAVLLWGSWRQHDINASVAAP